MKREWNVREKKQTKKDILDDKRKSLSKKLKNTYLGMKKSIVERE